MKTLDKDFDYISTSLEKKELVSRYKDALKANKKLEKEKEVALDLKRSTKTVKITPTTSKSSESTAVIVASDWHIEETVNPRTINNLNKYNLEIATQRAYNFFSNSVKLVKIFQKDTKVDNIILALLGDFISGNIHDELLENCSLQPAQAIIKAQELIASGIEYILANTSCKLTIPCSSGNHGRMTAKLHISTENGNSLETLLYYSLAQRFLGNKRVQFILDEGYLTYLDVYGYRLRFHHGHAVKFNGGIGGPIISLNKAIAQWDKSHRADYTIMGHFHGLKDYGNAVINGSLIGYNAFALNIKADYEKPKQAFFLIDKEHGKTVSAPIFLE